MAAVAPGHSLPLLAVSTALAVFVALEIRILGATAGFEYPLDDPYIHLAMAENILRGTYGVNLGEPASAASSALYPVLLMPFSGSAAQRYMPLAVNAAALVAAAWLWGRVLAEAGMDRGRWRSAGLAAAALGPAAVFMPSVAALGMEHTLHAAASLVLLLGLLRFAATGGGTGLVLAGAVLAPLLRLEGLALAGLAAGFLMLSGAPRAGAAALGLALAVAAGFALFLLGQGLEPVPSSVQTKLETAVEIGALARLWHGLSLNLASLGGLILSAYVMLALFAAGRLAGRWRGLALVLALAGFAHLAFGRIGWLDRYEHYAIVLLAAGLAALLPRALPRGAALAALGAVLAVPLAFYTPRAFVVLPAAASGIEAQQREMARLARDHLAAPVAVNDIGWVSWQNDAYVLDLWGLASPEARDLRLSGAADGWAGPLAAARGVPVAMIYEAFLPGAPGPGWVLAGHLVLARRAGAIAAAEVAIYATAPEHLPMLQAALADWAPGLDGRSAFRAAEAAR